VAAAGKSFQTSQKKGHVRAELAIICHGLSINPLPPFGKPLHLASCYVRITWVLRIFGKTAIDALSRAEQRKAWYSLADKIGVAPGIMEAHPVPDSFDAENDRLFA
jgi:hypothetical protein